MAKKEAKTNKKDNSKNKKSFSKDFKAELKKVAWPTPKQLLNNTVAVITIVLIIILIIVCMFLFDLGRKVGILSKYSSKNSEYSKYTNFYKKINSEEDTITEFWRKENLGFLKRTSKDDVKMIYYGKDYNWIIVDNKDGKTAVKTIKTI